MKWAASLVALVVATIYWSENHTAEASIHWSIKNQLKIEERPYTTPQNVRSKVFEPMRNKANKLLTPSLRQMQRYCDGQCFYAPADCDIDKYGCKLIASVALHNEDPTGIMYCEYFGEDPLKESFCHQSTAQNEYRQKNAPTTDHDKDPGPPDRFYTVTLHRSFGGRFPCDKKPSSSCPKRWNDKNGRKCRKTEFVAISFVKEPSKDAGAPAPTNGAPAPPGVPPAPPSVPPTPTNVPPAPHGGESGCDDKDGGENLDPDDVWYVCTVDENHLSRVTMWTQISNDNSSAPYQIMGTRPHLESGTSTLSLAWRMGVVFSSIVFDEEIASMVCQFIIQQSNMTLAVPPKNAAFFGNSSHSPITIKLATGYVERDDDNDDHFRRPFRKFKSEPFSYFNVYSGNDQIKPINKLELDKMRVDLKNPYVNEEMEGNIETESDAAMISLIDKCGHPENYKDILISCYPPNKQQQCIRTGRCPVMFVVEVDSKDRSFKTIRAHLYGSIPESRSLRKATRPMGFASVGFSKDDKMGRDVVITCHADGRDKVRAYVSINFIKNNIYPGKVSYDHLIWNRTSHGTVERPRILCSWAMNTSFAVNMFAYEPDYQDVIRVGESEKLAFNFSEERVHLLLSAGNRNYPGGTIVRHDFAEVQERYFGKEEFYAKDTEP